MKISVNWLNQFTDIDITVDELVQKIGAQLGAVEEVIDLGKKYQGIVIAKVVSCEKHPNADKLSVCRVDDGGVTEGVERGEDGLVQVVCGAPNVRAGLTVAWLPPGATVPSTFEKDPFILGARELRGVMSNGMLASAAELAISDDHTGIVEVDIDVAPGTSFADAYELNDYVIDVENKMFTHRPDCFGILGVAREVAGIQHKAFQSPDWYLNPLDRVKPGKDRVTVQIKNTIPELVPRFMAVAMSEVTVKPSPLSLQIDLARVGLRPINNIVDITNYLMYLTGQPNHAYDADKLRQYGELSIETRLSRKGDKISLLNGKEVELQDENTILITSNDVPIGIAGAMGGADTEVDETTKNIVIECANFDMYAIRKASMRYGLFTDAVTRFNKGQSPYQNDRVLEEIVTMVQSLAGAHVVSEVIDVNSVTVDPVSVRVSVQFVNDRLGFQLTAGEMAQLLRNVEFDVHEGSHELVVTPPFWRTDIEIAEDIVEEIGRLYGFDHLPQVLPRRSLKPAQKNEVLELKSVIRDVLSRAGANEVLTYSFVHGNMLDKVGQDRAAAFKLSNALSPDLQYYRLSLTPSLLEKVHPNVKAGYDKFAIFEMNKVHNKHRQDDHETNLPKEAINLSLIYTASDKAVGKHAGAAYYNAQQYLATLATALGIALEYAPLTEQPTHYGASPFDYQRTAQVKIVGTDTIIGLVGEYRQEVLDSFKLPAHTAGFEVDIQKLLQYQSADSQYVPLSRFPKVEQDVSLRVPAGVGYQTVTSALEAALENSRADEALVSLKPIDIYQKHGDTHRHYTYRYTVASYERTLMAEEVNNVLDAAASVLHEQLGAERI